jgi:predicted dehydrogenase
VLEARALATTGRLGTVVGVETAFVFRGKLRDRFLNTGWIQDLPGGAVHELAPHSVYLHREFLGKLSVASAVRKPIAGLAPDSMEFRALFEGESGLGILAISLSGSPQQSALRIYGTEMTVHIDLRGHTAVKARRDSGDSHLEKALPNLELGAQLAARTFAAMLAGQRLPVHREHAGLIRGFYGALRDGRPPPVTADDGRAVVAVLDRLWATLP